MATTNSNVKRALLWAKLALLVVSVACVGATINACGEVDTVLFVRVDGATSGTISQFAVTISVGEEIRAFTIPDEKKLINLPTSFTVQVPPAFEGVATLTVKALNDQGTVIGEGMATTTAVLIGKKNTIDVQIAPALSPLPDGGTPQPKDAGDAMASTDVGGDTKPLGDGGNKDATAPDAPVVRPPDASALDAMLPDAAAADAVVP